MLKSKLHGGLLIAASFCAVLFASCGITPLYHPPVSDKSPVEMFDADVCASLLKTGPLQSDDGEVTIAFSKYTDNDASAASPAKIDLEKYAVRGVATFTDSKNGENPSESWLPVLLVPFRHAGSLFLYLALDHMYLLETYKLNPEYFFMMHPYSYILKAEAKDGGWEVGFVQFATTGLEVKKVTDRVRIDEDGTVFNPPAEILDMLTDPENYKLSSKMLFLPVKTGK